MWSKEDEHRREYPGQSQSLLQITGGLLLFYVCLAFYKCVWLVCLCGAPVTQGHSCETTLIPLC